MNAWYKDLADSQKCDAEALSDKPFVTFSEMAEQLSVNRSAVQKQIEGFRKKGYLDRRDDGSWHVLALNSRVG